MAERPPPRRAPEPELPPEDDLDDLNDLDDLDDEPLLAEPGDDDDGDGALPLLEDAFPDDPLADLGEAEDADDPALALAADEQLDDPLDADWSDDDPLPPRRMEPVTGREVLPWRTRVALPDLGIELPAVLDPTRAASTWYVAEAIARDRVRTRVQLGGLLVEAELRVERSPQPCLHLGRDLLAGRVLVESEP